MTKRVILPPLKKGSRTPEEIREAVRVVMTTRDAATWQKVQRFDPDPIVIVADPPSGTREDR
ncbi:MAG TPA: hypothetical protein VLB76_08975 [Thermoanaerobaculia bacterium]|jgi:hypothetical protein|nr:hypothetical protein [Thermoanaerobaculia bacterium]